MIKNNKQQPLLTSNNNSLLSNCRTNASVSSEYDRTAVFRSRSNVLNSGITCCTLSNSIMSGRFLAMYLSVLRAASFTSFDEWTRFYKKKNKNSKTYLAIMIDRIALKHQNVNSKCILMPCLA